MKLLSKNLLLLAIVVVISVVPLTMYDDSEFSGVDGLAEEVITQVNSNYEPWFNPFWEPPGGEIESLLFALQAALGAGFIGYYVGYKRCQAKARKQ